MHKLCSLYFKKYVINPLCPCFKIKIEISEKSFQFIVYIYTILCIENSVSVLVNTKYYWLVMIHPVSKRLDVVNELRKCISLCCCNSALFISFVLQSFLALSKKTHNCGIFYTENRIFAM